MNIVKKEIRQALLGDLVPTDNKLVVSGRRMTKIRYGVWDGMGNVLILGVMCRRRWYMTKKSRKQIRELAVKAMQDMGRMVGLKSNPDLDTVYCSYLLNAPAILTFTQGKDAVIEVAAYSGRGLSGLIATFRTLNRFQKAMQDAMERMSETGEANRWNEIRQRELQDDRNQKLAKKKAKQEKKQARKQARQTGNAQSGGSFVQRLAGRLGQKTNIVQTKADPGQSGTNNIGKLEKTEITEKTEVTEKMSAQDRLAAGRAELEEAKLAAEEAAMKLAAAEARLAAQEAEAKLEAVQAKLAAQEAEAKQDSTQEAEGKQESTQPEKIESSNGNKSNKSNKNSHSSNKNTNRSRKKKH